MKLSKDILKTQNCLFARLDTIPLVRINLVSRMVVINSSSLLPLCNVCIRVRFCQPKLLQAYGRVIQVFTSTQTHLSIRPPDTQL